MAELTSYLRALSAFAFCLALASVAGCRNLDNAQTDVLERELRQQEDYIYELEDYLVEYSEKLRQARMAQCQPAATTTTTSPRTSPRSDAPLREPTIDTDPIERPTLPLNGRNKLPPPSTEAPPAESVAPPANEAPAAETPESQPQDDAEPAPVSPEDMEAPDLEIGPGVGALKSNGATAVAAAPTLPPESGASAPLLIPDPVDYQADGESFTADPVGSPEPSTQAATATPGEPRLAAPQQTVPRLSAERLKIRRVFAEPAKDDKSTGSLLVVVEALNATDEPVDAVGAASLMIMSRDAPGSLQRIERWDFTAEETAAAWQSSQLGDGLHLELPLSNGELPEGELELWARVVNEGGVKLLTPAEQPYRFEAGQLASMADAAEDTVLASTDDEKLTPDSVDAAQQTAAAEPSEAKAATGKTAASEAPKPQWRTSSVRLDQDRVEGFATTASGNKSGGWSTKPINDAQPRIASAPAKTGSPTWKRSSRAAAATESSPAWTPGR